MRPLHTRFPRLAAKLPHVSLAQLPTPITELPLVRGTMLAKLDGQTCAAYGGNKVRKLEYLLAQAQRHRCTRVATFGAAGSNHATATAVHARALGLNCTSFLSRQRATPWIAGNLWRQLEAGANIVFVTGDRAQRETQAEQWIAHCEERVWRIPMGGSSLAGAIGYVNAAIELADQLHDAETPDRIYVPLGTMGTAAGLAVGLAICGLRTPVHAVRVVHESVGCAAAAATYFTRLVRLLRKLDTSFPEVTFNPDQFVVRNEFFGAGYAHATDASILARAHASAQWNLNLETTYSGKALAAVLADQKSMSAPTRPLLWCTYGEPETEAVENPARLNQLPEPLHQYVFNKKFRDLPNP